MCGKPCEAYCNISMLACNSGNSLGFFSDYATCWKTCINYNSTGAYIGNGAGVGANVECKTYHATAALSDPVLHCQHASPSGNGGCGTACENYCQTMSVTCPTQAAASTPCAGFCSTINPLGNITDKGQDSVDCRIYHANNANITGDATHCLHATPSGGGVCGALCDVYCTLAMSVCTGPLALYGNTSACQTACKVFNSSGVPGAASGDTLQCRIYHIGAAVALNNLTYHCPHGGVVSGPCSSGSSTSTTGSTTSSGTGSTTSSGTGSSTKSTTGGVESLFISIIMLVAVLLF